MIILIIGLMFIALTLFRMKMNNKQILIDMRLDLLYIEGELICIKNSLRSKVDVIKTDYQFFDLKNFKI